MDDGALRFSHTFELVVLRHGRTAWNETGRFQGHADIPLDETGRAQAQALRTYLAGTVFARALASDLSRASETATIVLGERGPALERDARWREMRFGVWEGLTWAQIVERDPQLAGRPSTKPKFYTPEGGESFDELCVRVRDAVLDIDGRANDGDRVLVATHAGPLHALLRVVLGEAEADALRVRFDPATATRLALSPGGARVLELNRSGIASVS
jgi:broad specificity phosphatase PhoE